MYAFLPREAVTRFLMSCSDCQKRMHLQYNSSSNGIPLSLSTSPNGHADELAGVKSKHKVSATTTTAAKINRLMMRQQQQQLQQRSSPADSFNDTDDDPDEDDEADDRSYVPHSHHYSERRLEIVMDVNENQIETLNIPKPISSSRKSKGLVVATGAGATQRTAAILNTGNGVKHAMQGKKRGVKGPSITTTGKRVKEEPVCKKMRTVDGNSHVPVQQQAQEEEEEDEEGQSGLTNGESIESESGEQ